jgi:HlyD family secretion protein
LIKRKGASMKHKRPPIPVIIVLALVLLVAGYFGIKTLLPAPQTPLVASGTIEAVTVVISPEVGGRIFSVNVDEGSHIRAGDTLFTLDDSLLQAQLSASRANLDLAQAALSTAQAQYSVTLDAARAQSVTQRTAAWVAIQPVGYTLPGWYFSRFEDISAAQAEVEAARAASETAQSNLDALLNASNAAEFKTAENRILDARVAFLVAQDVLNRSRVANYNADLLSAAQAAFDAAQTELEDAQSAFDDLKDSEIGVTISTARAELAAAQERSESAQDRLLALQTGEFSPTVTAAAAIVDQASTAVTQAQAALDMVEVQISKLVVKAPSDGMLLTRSIEPGEVVAAGASALSLGQLDSLTITVYIPEETYGKISLGQTASVSVDSFPGETFTATVVHIADQAEFTPRNVQSVEGRKSTVFAIKLQVQDPEGKLKPGMPADVTFE